MCELNNCVRCGADTDFIVLLSSRKADDFEFHIECDLCGASTENFPTEREAIDEWNALN